MNSKNKSQEDNSPEMVNLFGNSLFDVEHALIMYASSFCTIPAEAIYNAEALEPYMNTIKSCHIYFIGSLPLIELADARQNGTSLSMEFSILDKRHVLITEIPEGFSLQQDEDFFYLENSLGERIWPKEIDIYNFLSLQTGMVNFEVKYIGQAYGKEGERNVLDRLLRHETLQKISLEGLPSGHRLSLLLLEIDNANNLMTLFNPRAKLKDENSSRIFSGFDKLYNTTEPERIALFEASFIRYFLPKYNKEFKNSFPSTNLKILQDCYDKDFAAVIAEINIDELPFNLFSDAIPAKKHHISKHDLHKDANRKMFFGF